MFGHERGAFTGASSTQLGKLAAADGGAVFLDEIGEVSLPVQTKLLRAMENRAIFRLGSTTPIHLNVRIVAATNANLESATAEGPFRKDLYYQLNVVRVDVPPLRERPEDVPQLIGRYLHLMNHDLGRSVRGLPSARWRRCARITGPETCASCAM